MMTETTAALTADQRAMMLDVIASTEKQIAELESYFAVTSIDAWPFVIVHEGIATPTALKVIDPAKNSYNFSAMGRDAAQYSRATAGRIVAELAETRPDLNLSVMGKYDFFKARLESARECLAMWRDMMAKREAA